MVTKARKLIKEQTAFVGEQARVLSGAPGTLVRRAAARSAAGVKALRNPARAVLHSGVRLTSLSQDTVQSLLELQLDVVTAALSNAAAQLERVSRARSVRDLVGGQAEELRAARERIAADIKRVIEILRHAGKRARTVASETVAEVRRRPGEAAAPARRTVRRKKAKRAVRKAKRAAR
jgi:phasin family protein